MEQEMELGMMCDFLLLIETLLANERKSISVYVCVYVHMCVHVHVCVCVCKMWVKLEKLIYSDVYVYTYIHSYIYPYIWHAQSILQSAFTYIIFLNLYKNPESHVLPVCLT